MAVLRYYAVVSASGELRGPYKSRGMKALYQTKAVAQRSARHEGDSVVEVFVDLSSPPLFIRGKVLDGDS